MTDFAEDGGCEKMRKDDFSLLSNLFPYDCWKCKYEAMAKEYCQSQEGEVSNLIII